MRRGVDGRAGAAPAFRFVDLFAGIGGFHAALSALGGAGVYASEIDRDAASVYEHNWSLAPAGDIVPATTGRMEVPEHDVLTAGFPCQPFSKSGYQRGMDEARGTLFWNILRVLEERKPKVVLLENVRNIAGPRHAHEWEVIIRSLREQGYLVSSTPAVFSPHLLPPSRGGRPQVRERVFITATHVGVDQSWKDAEPVARNRPVPGWDKDEWDLVEHLPLDDDEGAAVGQRHRMTREEEEWVDAWDELVHLLRSCGVERMPGFPMWADEFVHTEDLVIPPGTPAWKADFLRKNARLYTDHREVLDAWLARWGDLADFPPSRRKLEWQAQDTKSLWDTLLHFRPSGIRAKKASYVPALVAITQTSVLGPRRRRLTTREAARLQGLPDWFEFSGQRPALTFKQLGNGVNVGAAYHVLREHVRRDKVWLSDTHPELVEAVLGAPASPDSYLRDAAPRQLDLERRPADAAVAR